MSNDEQFVDLEEGLLNDPEYLLIRAADRVIDRACIACDRARRAGAEEQLPDWDDIPAGESQLLDPVASDPVLFWFETIIVVIAAASVAASIIIRAVA